MAGLPSLSQVAGIHAALYEVFYQQVDPAGTDRIGAMEAASFLKKSKLSDSILSKVWDLSDPNGKGFLDKRGFFVALKLVSLAQNGKDISLANIIASVPPPSLGDSHHSSGRMSPAIDWSIKPFDLSKYEDTFRTLALNDNKVSGNVVKPLMLNSNLPTETLVKIWELSDMDQDGALDRDEFILAMHLVSKAVEGFPIPAVLPPEILPATKRKMSFVSGPLHVMPDLLPGLDGSILNQTRRSSTPTVDVTLKNALNKVAVAAPWVVGAAEKAKSDELFFTLDNDQDGFVTGLDIKDTLLQSGLPPPVLAHIWNLCDMKQMGKLSSEQFSLAMHLISIKLQGVELPQELSPEMIPPTLRPKPGVDSLAALVLIPDTTVSTTGNKELDTLTVEIKKLQTEKLSLEEDVANKETEVKIKKNETQSLQKEQETLASMLKQLEVQKSEAKKRLTDLETQQVGIKSTLGELNTQLEEETTQVESLKQKLEEQTKSLETQEDELNTKRQELSELRNEEQGLEQQIKSGQNQLDSISKSLQDTQLQISQSKAKLNQLQEQQRQMSEGIETFDEAVASGSFNELSLRAATPLSELEYQRMATTGTSSPISNASAFSVPEAIDDFKEDPFKSKDPFGATNGFEVDPFAGEDPFVSDPFKSTVTNSVDLNRGFDSDPFAEAFPVEAVAPVIKGDPFGSVDPFGSFPVNSGKTDPFDPFTTGGGSIPNATKEFSGADPFGSDPFGATPVAPPRPESPTPALPPKKSKAPPPRPAPPRGPPAPVVTKTGPTRAAPAPPPPPSAAAIAAAHDPFSSNSVPADDSNHSSKVPDPFAPFFDNNQGFGKGTDDPFAAEDPFADKGGHDPFAEKSHDPFANAGGGASDSFANFADFEKFSPPPPYYPNYPSTTFPRAAVPKTKAILSEDQQLAWATEESFRLEQSRQERAAKQEQDDLELALALSRAETLPNPKKKSAKSRIKNALF